MQPEIYARPNLTLQAMQDVARAIARVIKSQDCITLRGDLGTGKTTFARALIEALSAAPVEVTSPTFTLMQSYPVRLADGADETLWHLDLYRLEEPSEADALALPELEAHVMLIEWPEIIDAQLPADRLAITLSHEKDDTRSLRINGNVAWLRRLSLVL